MKTTSREQKPITRPLSLRIQLGLAFFAFILIGANDGATGILLPSIGAQYSINKATLGLLFLAATAGYLVAAFNSGPLVEKLGSQRFLLLGGASFLVGAGVLSIRPPFSVVVLMLVPLGFGSGTLDAGLNAYIAGLPRSTAILNYLHAFYGTGALLGPIVASTMLAIGFAWNNVYLIWIAISLLLVSGVAIFFKKQKKAVAHEEGASSESNVLLAALRLRVVWIAALFLLFYVGTEVSLGSWSYSFLTEDRHGATLISGWIVSGYWVGLTVGRIVLGNVALRMSEMRLIQGCLIGVILCVLLIWLVPINAVSALGLFLTGFCLGPIFPTTIALMSKFVPSRLLTSAIGFLASLGSMGAAFFPWLAGNLAQFVGLWSLLPYVITLAVVMSLFWLGLRTFPRTSSVE